MKDRTDRTWRCRIPASHREPEYVRREFWHYSLPEVPIYPFCLEEMTQSSRSWYAEDFCQFMVLVLVTEGDLFYRIGEQEFLLVSGQLLVVPPGSSYFLQKGASVRYKKIVAEIKGNNLSSMAETLGLHRPQVIELSDWSGIHGLMKRIQSMLHESDEGRVPELLGLTYELLCAVSRESQHEQTSELFVRAQHLLESSLDRKVTIGEIAHRLGVNSATLNRLFQLRMHMTPMRYRLECRIARAHYLLLNTNVSVKEIAYQTGYCNPFYFSSEYRRIRGCSPRQTRQEHRF